MLPTDVYAFQAERMKFLNIHKILVIVECWYSITSEHESLRQVHNSDSVSHG